MDQNTVLKYLYNNKDIKKFCKDNKLSDNEVVSYFQELCAYKDYLEGCAACDGKTCKAKIKNQLMNIECIDGKLKTSYSPCNKIPSVNNSNYEVLCYTESDIDLISTQARVELMRFLLKFESEYSEKKFTKGIYLWGKCGTGKSLLLYKFGQKLASKGIKVIFAYYPDLVREFQNNFGTSELEALIVKLKKVDVLMIDDIGREANTQYIRDEILGPIMQYRVDNELPMFVSSNRNMKELQKHLSETNNTVDEIKGRALIERFKFLMKEYELVDKDFRN